MNAKKEFLDFVASVGKVVECAHVEYESLSSDKCITICLKKGFSESDYATFLSSLDFMYDDGFGGQELRGFIWFVGGTWADREEYDGSEWWEYRKRPEIPRELKK